MRRLIVGLLSVTVMLLILETAALVLIQTTGNSDLPVSNGMIGQPASQVANYQCWGMAEYTASCHLSQDETDEVVVDVTIRNNTIVMVTFRADHLLHIHDLVRQWGRPTVIEYRQRDIYMGWENSVYGRLTPTRVGATLDYTLTVWSGP